ncbi:hypothetical protein [Nonomuraea jabiensis]|uniref:hypothetical protein n=1 Tax=Nonomuraea jabiensis TaxID=882448 RepID=UPI003D75F3B5
MESDLSIWVRGAAIWTLHVATVVVAAWASITGAAPLGSRWLIVPVLGLVVYPLAVVAFILVPWGDRLLSALKASAQAMLLAVLVQWIDPRSTGSAAIVVIALSVSLAVAMWRSGRTERAAEAEERRKPS